MALTDQQQADLKNKVDTIFSALVALPEGGGMYYKTDAIINVVRSEVGDVKAGKILFPGANYLMATAIVNTVREQRGQAPIKVDEGALGKAIADAIRPTIAEALKGIDSGASATQVADELAKRLAA